MASFDENGKYIKTNWKAGDKITSTKLNKIEESIEAVNDNDISRHVEADARLDALEAKDEAHDKELTDIKNAIADNKAAAELGDYDINSRMTFLEEELNEGIEEVHNVASTVDGKIAAADTSMKAQVTTAKNEMTTQVNAAQANMTAQVDSAVNTMTAQVNQGKADMEAMIVEVDGKIAEAEANMTNATNEMTTQVNDAKSEMTTQVNNAKSDMTAQVTTAQANMTAQVTTAKNEMTAQVNTAQANMTTQVNNAKSEMTAQVNSATNVMNTAQSNMQAMVEHVETEIFTFENRIEDEWDGLHENVANYVDIESNSFTLGIHEDGLLYIFKDGSPKGVGIEMLSQEVIAGDVIGFVDASNNIVISGALAEGVYTLKYEMDDGTIVTVGEISTVTKPPFINQIPISINSDGTLYNGGQGWKTGYRISKSSGGESAATNYECTGFIPVTPASRIRVKGIDVTATDESNVLCGYDKNFTKLNTGNGVTLGALIESTDANGVSTFKNFAGFTHFASNELAYVRLSSIHIDNDSIITVDEPII